MGKVIKLAERIAREREREYMGTQHLLLAIQREGTGVGAKILAKRGITYDKLYAELNKLVKTSTEEAWVLGRLPSTPHFKKMMAAAVEQCQKLGANEVCTEHLLLALWMEQGSVAQKALQGLGLTYDDLYNDIVELTSE